MLSHQSASERFLTLECSLWRISAYVQTARIAVDSLESEKTAIAISQVLADTEKMFRQLAHDLEQVGIDISIELGEIPETPPTTNEILMQIARVIASEH